MLYLLLCRHYNLLFYYLQKVKYKLQFQVHLLINFFNHFWFQHDSAPQMLYLLLCRHYNLLFYYLQKVKYKLHLLKIRMGIIRITAIYFISEDPPR